jgi:DUF2892 family protein
MFRKNEGPVDRTIRVVAGIALIAIGLLLLDGLEASIVGIVLPTFGLWLIVTGAIGFCPLYVPFGIDTHRKGHVKTYRRGPVVPAH